jgi:GntP family gluconate:H+ symporter
MATVLASSMLTVHCLIPTHPGALAGAGILNVNVGYLIITGIIFSIPGAIAAYFWSKWMTKGKNYPPAKDIEVDVNLNKDSLPPIGLSLLPIAIPLLLITIKSLLNLVDKGGTSLISRMFYFPGEPIIALAIGVVLALLLVKRKSINSINSIFTEALEKAGPILIVTAAGGMFGMVIKATGTGEVLGRALTGTSLGLVIPFLISSVMKTAQGSATVAIITTAAFVEPMISILGLDSEVGRLFTMLAIGAGSMLVSHANDSYFWVVSNFSDIDPDTTLKVYSTTTIVTGFVVFAFVWVASVFVL